MNCKECNKEIDGNYGSGKYCNKECAKKGRNKKITEIQLAKGKKDRHYKCEKCSEDFILKYTIKPGRKIHCDKCKRKAPHIKNLNDIRSICQLSSRTISKILKRAEIKCSMCG